MHLYVLSKVFVLKENLSRDVYRNIEKKDLGVPGEWKDEDKLYSAEPVLSK